MRQPKCDYGESKLEEVEGRYRVTMKSSRRLIWYIKMVLLALKQFANVVVFLKENNK